MNQIVLGASIPFIFFLLVYIFRRMRAGFGWLISAPLAMAAGAIWAVVPDLPRLFGNYALYKTWMHAPWTDIFFWHYTIDHIESPNLAPWGAGFVLIALALLWIAWRELQRAENSCRGRQESSQIPLIPDGLASRRPRRR